MSDKQKELKANLLQMMFPRNGEKIPEVRLAGFAEDWSQRTLEDISDKVTEKNKAREFTETLTNSAEYGIISQSDYFDKDISNINNIDGYYVVRPDDFVYNPRISNFAPVGPIKRNNLNRIGIMSPLYYVFRPKRVDHTFLEKYFETSYWHIFMKMNGDSGARADRFAIKDTILKEMPIPYPIKEEQVKIGIFFNQLDMSIVLHQEKIAHLKVLKSTLLNKMFI
jgi:type I restriction enzyme S subunit